jgi:Domain of unknown function (DUF4167)
MRQGQNRRMRGRNRSGGGGGGGGRGPNPLQRSYESNGPDVKVRGTAQHIAEKYAQLARDSQSSGDPVMAESYFQHAEHYWRIVLAAQEQMTQQYGHQFQPARPFGEEGEDGDDEGDDEGSHYPSGADQPLGTGQMGNPDDQPFSQEGRGQPGPRDNPREGQRDNQRDNGWRNDNQNRDNQNRNDNRGDRNGQRFDRQGGQGQDRNNQDRNNQDRNNQDRNNPDRNQGDRNNNDRNSNHRFDRQGGQGGDRPNNDRPNNDRNERFGRDRGRFERPRRDDQNGDQPRFEDQEQPDRVQPERMQQAEVEGRQPRAVIDADAAPIGLPSFVTQPRRKTIEIDADQPDAAPAAEAVEAAPRRRGRPPGARNKQKAEAEGTAE